MVDNIKKVVLAISMALITAVSAQIRFKVGPVPYTMQNFGVMLSGFILGPKYGGVAMLIYLALIALGLPLAAGGGGLGVLLGPTAGFLVGFVASAALAGFFRRLIWRKNGKVELTLLWLSTIVAALPTYALGFFVFYSFAASNAKLLAWAENAAKTFGISQLSPIATVFVATVLIFIPQDVFVDHLLAVLTFRYVYEMLRERGVELD